MYTLSDPGLSTVSVDICCFPATELVSMILSRVESPSFQVTETPFGRTLEMVHVIVVLVPALTSAPVASTAEMIIVSTIVNFPYQFHHC